MAYADACFHYCIIYTSIAMLVWWSPACLVEPHPRSHLFGCALFKHPPAECGGFTCPSSVDPHLRLRDLPSETF